MKLNHEGEYICECEMWEEPVLYPVAELIRCRECKWYLPNYTKSPFDTDGFDRWGGLANCQNENGLTECSDESYCSCGARMDSYETES